MMTDRRRHHRGQPLSRRLFSEVLEDRRMLHGLNTGSGDGSLTVGVDGYGAFGSAVGSPESGPAIYDPIGSIRAASTTFQSGVAFRLGSSGPRQFLTDGDIGGSGGLPGVAVTGSTTSATSTFSFGGVSIQLLQAVAPMTDSRGARTGSILGQTYRVLNSGATPIDFEFIRYLDGDLLFDGSLVDGGGRITLSNSQFLFETDSGGTGTTSTTFVGIDASGGTIPTSARFEVNSFSGLEERIIAGTPLDDAVAGDNNGDGFIDAGAEYDVTLALRNVFNVAPGATAIYSTRTVFGSGTPGSVSITNPTVDIGPDVSHLEGDSGLTNFVFPITLSQALLTAVTVVYSTQDITANAGSDYIPQSGTLTFLPGDPTSQNVTVQVKGDLIGEPDETFRVQLTAADGGDLGRSAAIGTILNDDADISINDVTVLEGDSGTSNAVFTVSIIGAVSRTITVNYTTAADTAFATSDFLPRSGVLTFAPGTFSRTVTVPIVGDKLNELTEDFFVNLSNPVNARFVKSVGTGTILDNDPRPSLYVSDVQVTTTEDGLLAAVFSVALDVPSGLNVTVQYATADGVAKANTDYLSKAGTVSFPQGSIKQLVTVPVLGSAVYGPNEKFYLNLFSPVNALLADSQGVGTIVFAPPPVSETIVDDGEEGFMQSLAGWSSATNLTAYHSDYMIHAPGTGTGTATWAFGGILPGQYQVFARWIAFSTFASNAPYTVFDGSTSQGTVRVNQQLLPTGDSSNGVVWQSLGTYNNTTGTLKVQLGDNANGYVISDAIRIVAGGIGAQVPEMDVSSQDVSIGDGASAPQFTDGTDFGTLPATTGATTHTFTITNTGNGDLHLSGSPHVTISGAAAQDYTVVAQPADTVAPGRTTTFQVMFHPSAAGFRQAFISIANDDSSESNYSFEIGGTGTDAGLNELIVDDSSSNFSLSGNWTSAASASAVQGEFRSDAAGQGNDHATWTFPGLAPGNYQVFTTWVPFSNRATNAPFTVLNGSSSQTVLVNQQQTPNDAAAEGVAWKLLTTVDLATGTLTVSLNNQANGFVIADAIRIVRVDPPAAAAIHNVSMPLDVNGDHVVSPMDALVVINQLIAQSSNSATASASPQVATTAATTDSSTAQYFLDVNDDTIVSPIDALIVINFLNQPGALASSSSVSLAASPAASTLTASSSAVPAATSENAVDQAISQLDAGSSVPSGVTSDTAMNGATVAVSVPAGNASVTVAATNSGTAPLLSPANVRAAFSATSFKKSPSDSDSDSLLD